MARPYRQLLNYEWGHSVVPAALIRIRAVLVSAH